jgi:hypothetical protein
MQPYTFHQRVENLYKSYFTSYEDISINVEADAIKIYVIDETNLDSACLELKINEACHVITFWDGYSQSEIIETINEKDAAKTLKRFMKKLVKIISR